MGTHPAPDSAAPSAAVLAGLDSNRWSQLVPVARAALHDLDGADVTPLVARLRAAPVSRLAGGRVRRDLCELLAQGGAAWEALRARIELLDPVPDGLTWIVDREDEPAGSLATGPPARPAGSRRRPAAEPERQELDRARQRVREARADRDVWRRRAEGAEARAEAATRGLASARAELEVTRAELTAVRAELAAEVEERSRGVERERRRRDAEVAALREELAVLRRAEEERRREQRRRVEARQLAERDAAREVEQARRSLDGGRSSRVVPGRPSALPPGMAPGTTEAAKALLHPGRLVLVDGYNVTLAHRGQLDLETQRKWLVQLLATLVAQRRIRAVVVFDGELAGGGRRQPGVRDVQVRFTAAGVSADDELVLAVEGTDEPVVVVTDDRELRARVAACGADVIGTLAFLGTAS